MERPRWWGIGALALMLGGIVSAGCGRGREVKQIRLEGIGEAAIGPDGVLSIRGVALPVGRELSVELHGVLIAPARAERALSWSHPARVISPERVEVDADPELFAQGAGSFRGSLRVRCSDGACAGQLADVSLELDADAEPSEASSRVARAAAQVFLQQAGMEGVEPEVSSAGLLVARVVPGGSAARGGLRVGDHLEFANGVRTRRLADLAPAPGASSVTLKVIGSDGARRSLVVPLLAAAPFADPRLLGLYLLGCPILLALLWLAKAPTPGASLRGAASALRGRGSVSATDARRALELTTLGSEHRSTPVGESVASEARTRSGSAPAGAKMSPAVSLLGVVASCALGGAFVLVPRELDVFVVLLAHAGLRLALVARRWPPVSSREELRASVVQGALIWLGVVSVAALSGTRGWLELANDQGAWPWEWNVLSRPPLMAAGALCLWQGARLQTAARALAADSAPARALEQLGRSLLAVLFATLFLGSAGSGLAGGPLAIALASILTSVKCLGVYVLLGLGSLDALAQVKTSRKAQLVLAGCVVILTMLWLPLAPSRSLEVAIGGGACTFALFYTAAALLEVARGRQQLSLPTRSQPLA